MKAFLFQVVFLLSVFIQPLSAQNNKFKCPWDEIDCPGKCGRFFDADGDGFCDYGRVSKVEKKDTIVRKDTVAIKKENVAGTNVIPAEESSKVIVDADSDSVQLESEAVPEIKNEIKTPSKARSYSLLLITLLCFGFYGFTSFLMELKLFRKFVHRRIWNILLLLTFLTTAVLVIVLVVQINYQLDSSLIRDYLYWHVQFGIAMSVISVIHIFWHWKYFYRIFSKKSKSDCVN
ncbi:MAG: hypothetical protein AB7V36_08675 [Bacteroidales bacterium]